MLKRRGDGRVYHISFKILLASVLIYLFQKNSVYLPSKKESVYIFIVEVTVNETG
jgi:hypothetical protein